MERPDAEDRRAATTESLYRAVNEQLEELGTEGDVHEYVCECSSADCVERISMCVDDYEDIRGSPVRFVIRPGHADARESVVEKACRFWVVEKTGAAGHLAVAFDPRG